MASSIQKYIPIRDCIFMYSTLAKKSEAEFLRLWQIAFLGYQQMGLNGFFATKTDTVYVNENKTITKPCDYLQWVEIKPVSGIGTYVVNRKLSCVNDFYEDISCFVFHPDFADSEVTMKYVFAPSVDCDTNDYVIPMEFQSAFIAYLGWQDIALLPSTGHVGNNTIQMRANAFRGQLSLAKKMYKPFRPQEFEKGEIYNERRFYVSK